MAKKNKLEQLEQDIAVVKSLMAGDKLTLEEIADKHPQLSAAVNFVREETAAVKKVAKPTGSGCSARRPTRAEAFI